MSDARIIQFADFSRRSLFRKIGTSAAGAAIVGMTATAAHQAAAQSKTPQKAVGYQTMPKGAQQCDGCTLFQAPGSCKVVEGDIAPGGWCRLFIKKPA